MTGPSGSSRGSPCFAFASLGRRQVKGKRASTFTKGDVGEGKGGRDKGGEEVKRERERRKGREMRRRGGRGEINKGEGEERI